MKTDPQEEISYRVAPSSMRPTPIRKRMMKSAIDVKKKELRLFDEDNTVGLLTRYRHRSGALPTSQVQRYKTRYYVFLSRLLFLLAPLQLCCFSILAIATEQDEQTDRESQGSSRGIYSDVVEAYGSQASWKGLDSFPDIANVVISHEGNTRSLKQSGAMPLSTGNKKYTIYSIGKGKSKKGPKGRPPPPPPRRPRPNPAPKPHSHYHPHPHPRPVLPPYIPIAPYPTPNPPPSGGGGGAGSPCVTSLKVEFLQFSALPPAVFIDPDDPNEQVLGTQYVYNDSLFDQTTMDEIMGSRATGVCTRTQSRVINAALGEFQLGGGYCQFVFTLSYGGNPVMFTAAGEVRDRDGGILPITGGSQGFSGAYGEIELIPVQIVNTQQYDIEDGDFFLAPLVYLADAAIFIPCQAAT